MQIENCKLKIAKGVRPKRTIIARARLAHKAAHVAARTHIAARTAIAERTPIAERTSLYRRICNLQSAIFNFQCRYVLLPGALLLALCATASAQTVSDKTVASVTNGSAAVPDLITYSDLVWQLALEPGRPLTENPSSEALNQALERLEEQLLVLQEARKLPLAQTPDAQKDFDNAVKQTRDDLAQRFGSAAQLQERMRRVGLTSEQLDQILRDRVTMERYVDFRFRPFALVGPKEIADRYAKEAAALRGTGKIVPTLEKVQDRIERDLIEEKIQDEIEKFIEKLRDQPSTEIVILNRV